MPARRFPPPWAIVRNRRGQQLAYVHFEEELSAAKPVATRLDSVCTIRRWQPKH